MDINDLLIFARVAHIGGFSKAAKTLRMPVSTVSRRVAKLEAELGLPLLVRTTRSLKITDVGKAYLEHGQAIALELEKAQLLATNLVSIPQGTLKITATTDFGNQFLGDIVDAFVKTNPGVTVDVVLTERVVDLIEEGFDLAIRIGELDDSTQLARKLGVIDMRLYASTKFLKAQGTPKTPRDLSKFECVLFTGDENPDRWRLKSQRSDMTVPVSGKILCNNMALVRDFVLSGRGIGLMPHFFCAQDVESGRLAVVLPEWSFAAGPIHVVYPGQRYQLPRVKAFVEHLTRACAAVEWAHRA